MKLHLPRRRVSRGHPRVAKRDSGAARVASEEPIRGGRGLADDEMSGAGGERGGSPVAFVDDDNDNSFALERAGKWRSRRGSPRRRGEDVGDVRRAPPIKQPIWKWYIPIYFWSGGISAGAWLAAAAEDITGGSDRDLIRAARYIAAGGIAAGTVLLIADLGRPDRFLHMLRIVRPRSTMSLGSWGLTAFGAWSGLAALLQALDDGLLGRSRIFARLSRGQAGWVLHAMGLPLALFVGGYTGVLLGTTSVPSWARRARLLGPLFTSSAISTGMSAVSLALDATGGATRSGARRRLARSESVALAAELALAMINHRAARSLPSARDESSFVRAARALMFGAGMALPLAAQLRSSTSRRHSGSSPLAALLTLAGGLTLRFITTHEGRRSALTPDDNWVHTGGEARGELAPRRARPAGVPSISRGEVRGVITILQEDRIRVVDAVGRGYLFTVAKRRAPTNVLEAWRDQRVPVRVRYRGIPDVMARAERIDVINGV